MLRAELLSIEQLKRHAITLAKQHQINTHAGPDKLLARLAENEQVISKAYLIITTLGINSEKSNQKLSPAENWLLDNYYLIQQQFTLARRHLPRGYSRQLPRILDGASEGFPRIYDLALSLISHMDGRVDKANATQFISAYQGVEPLMLGELWAFPIMLQLSLLENLRRVAVRIANVRQEQEQAIIWADRMLVAAENAPKQLIQLLAKFAAADIPLTAPFVEEFYSKLQDQGSSMMFVQTWVEQQLLLQNITATQLLESASRKAAANQISIANSISSLRFISAMDWRNFVESCSVVEQILAEDPASEYARQDFATRDRYRHAVEDIAYLCAKKNSNRLTQFFTSNQNKQNNNHCAEFEIKTAQQAVELAQLAKNTLVHNHRSGHVGYYLVDDGVCNLKDKLNCRSRLSFILGRACKPYSLSLYLSAIMGLSTILTASLVIIFNQYFLENNAFSNFALNTSFTGFLLAIFSLFGLVASSSLAVAIVNLIVTKTFKPHILPRLDFSKGIPEQHRCMVVVPTLIGSKLEIDSLIEALEIRYLGNQDAQLFFALLTDFRDAQSREMPEDAALIAHMQACIEALNTKYLVDRACIFYSFHRQREWNEIDKIWMGYERKRGKLEQFNTLLRDGDMESVNKNGFSNIVGDKSILSSIQYIITLDTDMQLPRDSARQLIGNMAHTLNKPVFDANIGRVTQGYGILQPRTSVGLVSASQTLFSQLYAGDSGIDPYTREVSDVYQDIFAEGSYVGKGIYHIDAFRIAIDGFMPSNLILSHDLLESGYARSALVTDVDLIEDYPASYLMDINRRHRWIRGDWQLAGWLLPKVRAMDGLSANRRPNPLSALLRWKIIDNLRRSLVPIALFLLLMTSVVLIFAPKSGWLILTFVMMIIYLPACLNGLLTLFKKQSESSILAHLKSAFQSIGSAFWVATLQLIFLPFEMAIHIDAIINSAGRMLFTKRGLMQWHSSVYARRNACISLSEFYSEMWVSPVIAIILFIFIIGIELLISPLTSHLSSPWLLSGPILISWFLAPLLAWVISKPITSKELGLTASQQVFLHEQAKLTWQYFAQFVNAENNWLPPDNVQVYPSTMVAPRTSPTNMGMGLLANLAAYDFGYIQADELLMLTEKTVASMEKLSRHHGHFYNWYNTQNLQVLHPQYVSTVDSGNLMGCLITLQAGLLEINSAQYLQKIEDLNVRIAKLADMDFLFLYDDATDLLSIGFDVGERRRDPSCYDLLASEARLASYILIAKNQLPQKHWFSLGRLLTKVNGEISLISWSGSMFEYLMPNLLLPDFENTLLFQTGKAVIKQQIKYGQLHNIPWGISESCYNVTDIAQVYQYRAFGVPGLGFKRGLADDLVIAPYATALALMVLPNEACQNLQKLADSGFVGDYGFYEAIDYTPNRLPRGKTHEVVQTFMAHHQGMSLLSFAHVLLKKPMQRRFMQAPYIKAAELLLQERIPKQVSTLQPHAEEANAAKTMGHDESTTVMRVFTHANTTIPEVHLLSNGRYHVMTTNSGGGYSRWHDLSVTRWREDTTLDNWGSFIYLRDAESQRYWSAAHQPTLRQADSYEAVFSQARTEYRRRDQAIESHTEITISPEDDVEIRRVTLTNLSNRTRYIEVTSYQEIVLAPQNADLAHRSFSNLFVQTEILHDHQAILSTRRPRTKDERVPWMFHLIASPGVESNQPSYETDRTKFIGRGRSSVNPIMLDSQYLQTKSNLIEQVSNQISGQFFGKQAIKNTMHKLQPLSNTDGSVLDPIAAIRRTVKVTTDETTKLQVITGVASSREAAIALIEKYGDRHFVERAFEMAWFQSQEVLRMLNATEADAQVYGRLASSVIYCNALRRAAPGVIARNQLGQSGLWRFGISGDLPIVLIRIGDLSRVELVKQLLQAHIYWRMNGLIVDLVIINEDFSGYRAALQDSIIGIINAGPEAQTIDKPGGVFIRRIEELSEEARVLLQSVARIVFTDSDESLIDQVEQRLTIDKTSERMADNLEPMSEIANDVTIKQPERSLIFNNGLGGFTQDGREYVITLKAGQTTPAPWANVIASPHIGTVVSESGGAYTWVENAHEFRLTTWHNDPLSDVSAEAHFVRDDDTGAFWSPTPLPASTVAQQNSEYVCRHGFGYSVFEHHEFGISSELTTYVAMDTPVKLVTIKLKNTSSRTRQLSVMGFWELVMGEWRHTNLMHLVTEMDIQTGALLARNTFGLECANRIVFAHVSEKENSFTGNRTEFIGRNSSLSSPAAMRRKRLSGKVGAGLDPCAALQTQLTLSENQEKELVLIFGAAKSVDEIHGYVQQMGGVAGARQTLDKVHEYWNHTLSAVQVETPDAALNVLANGWLVYQTISCRLWGRSGYYQSGGAFGFRDQLQDTMALIHATPWLAREQIIRCAERQFPQGDVQHWWHPPNGQGVRTHFSDDYLWLVYATCRYVIATGDTAILVEQIHFLEGRSLNPSEEAYYDLPQRSNETANLYDHCVRSLKNGLKFGAHQLPLMGCGDWNDGMNLVGKDGKGESVWLAWFLVDNLIKFSKIASDKSDLKFAETCTTQAALIKGAIETNAWDGEWYKRAFFDDGTPLGSKDNTECQIDSISQSWAVISKSGDSARARQAMASVNNRLVQRDAQLIKLLDPPFDQSDLEPGYIKGYVPGVRENGGQYTHAAIWATMAFAMQGDNERAWELFGMLNPINHSESLEQVNIYKVEPYVMSADVYVSAPHRGRGGWTWYTGAAGWMYRLTLETLLGITVEDNQLVIAPCVPASWQNYKIHYRYRDTIYHITINCNNLQTVKTVKLIPLIDDHAEHFVQIDF